jgi:hypothetical protein
MHAAFAQEQLEHSGLALSHYNSVSMEFCERLDLNAFTFCLRLLHLWQATRTRGRLLDAAGLYSYIQDFHPF